jgi:hypothetical protein
MNKITTFRKLDLISSLGKKEKSKHYLLGPLVELDLDMESYNTEIPGTRNCG